MMSTLEEMMKALDEFCDKEYNSDWQLSSRSGLKETANNLSLYAADCGGYDITGRVRLDLEDGRFFLRVYKDNPAYDEYIEAHDGSYPLYGTIPETLLHAELELVPKV